MFSTRSKLTLARSTLLQDTPVYVQFYITARCNLTCKQCNIIYANSDVREATLDEIRHMADNFATMGVAMVLLDTAAAMRAHGRLTAWCHEERAFVQADRQGKIVPLRRA